MKQFYEAYESSPDLIPLLKEVTWTNNLTIFSPTKSQDEREFYLKLCIREKYSARELDRRINSSIFERTVIGNSKLSAELREIHPNIDISLSKEKCPTSVRFRKAVCCW
ncbi:putative nuclease of restriction endonuclease-like (RecB) superfamily [Chitinophaga sp. W2I13]